MANPNKEFVIGSITRAEIADICNDMIIAGITKKGARTIWNITKDGLYILVAKDSKDLTDEFCARFARGLNKQFDHDDDAEDHESNLVIQLLKDIGYTVKC